MLCLDSHESPLGRMFSITSETALYLLEFTNRRNIDKSLDYFRNNTSMNVQEGKNEQSAKLGEALAAYFADATQTFTIPLEFHGTAFQKSVWTALLAVAVGQTIAYSELAERIGRPSATRAVANAVGQNRISIIVPCHRIIGKDGSLTGYASGIDRKRFLLKHEGATFQD